MKDSNLTSGPHSGRTPREAPSPGTEAAFLEDRASRARSALRDAVGNLRSDLGKGLSLRSWVREFPWASIGIGALAGLAAGYGTRRHATARPAGARTPPDALPRRCLPRKRSGAPRRLAGLLAGPVAALVQGLWTGAPRGRRLRIADRTLTPDSGTREFDLRPPPRGKDTHGESSRSREGRPGERREAAQPKRSRLGTTWYMARRTFTEWSEDNCFRLAAALAYYTVFSLAPLLLIVIAVVGLVYKREDAQTAILDQIHSLFGEKGAAGVEALLEGAAKDTSENILATAIGIGALVFGATGVLTELKDSLNTIWEVKPRPGMGIIRWVTTRLLSFGIVVGIGFLLLVWLIVSAALAAMGKFLEAMLPLPPEALHAINLAGSFLIITLLFAMIYKVLPDVSLAWRHVFIGAAITAALFTLGKFLIGLYLGQAAVSSSFGAAGSILIVLLWAYYSSLIFLLGAEFTQVYARVTRPDLIVHEDSVPLTESERVQEGVPHRESIPEPAPANLAGRRAMNPTPGASRAASAS